MIKIICVYKCLHSIFQTNSISPQVIFEAEHYYKSLQQFAPGFLWTSELLNKIIQILACSKNLTNLCETLLWILKRYENTHYTLYTGRCVVYMSNFWEWQICIWPIFQKFKKWNCKLEFPQLVKTINALIRHIFWTLWIGTWELLWETGNISIPDASNKAFLAKHFSVWSNIITTFLLQYL